MSDDKEPDRENAVAIAATSITRRGFLTARAGAGRGRNDGRRGHGAVGRERQDGVSDPNTWKRWYEAGCDFLGYAWGTPPDFRPHAKYAQELEITRNAYRAVP